MLDFFSRHSRIALMFSGGKDSVACLLLCRAYWGRITVVWVNPGNPYPETVEQMARIRAMVPNFVEVPGRQPQFIRECGYPVDMVPVGMTRIGRVLSRTSGVFVVPYNECCGHNLWAPAIEHIRLAGYTGIIRGDKLADALKPPVLSGETHDGIEYLFPVEGWTDVEIGDYLGDSIPQYYRRGIRTSLDCINCTAYLDHNIERLRDLEVTDPRVHAEVTGVLHAVSAEVGRYIESLQSAGGESWVSA